jgi:hypothetical protein
VAAFRERGGSGVAAARDDVEALEDVRPADRVLYGCAGGRGVVRRGVGGHTTRSPPAPPRSGSAA